MPRSRPAPESVAPLGGWLTEALRRRVPHYLGVYLGGSFAILQFVAWATDRYLLSPHLPDLALALLAFFLPSVLVHAWYHGEPGRDPWCRFEKACIGANVLVAGVVLLLVFGGKDLGGATTEVTLVDEEGAVSTRTVPKAGFRRRVALFPFNSSAGDSVAAALRDAVPWLLHMDLLQDLFVYTRYDFSPDHVRPGADVSIASPATLREIALDHDLKHYVSGSLASAGSSFRLTTRLYETRRGDRLAETEFRGRDLFALVDSASLRLKRDLGIPSRHVETTVDLPVEHLTTSDTRALARAVAGERALERRDWREAVTLLGDAVRRDSTFAAAWGSLSAAYLVMNDPDSARYAVDRAMPYSAELPETRRTNLKSLYFTLQGDRQKVLRLARMQVTLHPDALEAHDRLAWEFRTQGMWEEALSEYRVMLELDPDHSEALREIGTALRRLGRHREAAAAYERYLERHPQEPAVLLDLADLHLSLGDLDQAAGVYERAHLIEPDALRPRLGLADIARRAGDFDAARDQLTRARELAAGPLEQMQVRQAVSEIRRMRGQVDSARAALSPANPEPPAFELANEVVSLELEAVAGQPDEAWRRLRSLEEELEPPWDEAIRLGELLIHRGLEDPEGTERSLSSARGALQSLFGPEAFEYLYLAAEGDLHRWRDECRRAVQLYRRSIEADPEDQRVWTSLGTCLRRQGRLDEARRWLEEGLALVPAEPVLHVEMARLERQEGDTTAALRHLRRALDVWSAADPDYAPAREARELLARWEGDRRVSRR